MIQKCGQGAPMAGHLGPALRLYGPWAGLSGLSALAGQGPWAPGEWALWHMDSAPYGLHGRLDHWVSGPRAPRRPLVSSL
eukprot:9503956-Pyramimonas_sp.AAC.2